MSGLACGMPFIGKFMVLGHCIGGPFIYNFLRRAPDRVWKCAISSTKQ
jgi:hypothetical protein